MMVLAAASLSALPWGPGGGHAGRAARIQVVTTTSVFADLIANVGGERVQVVPLLPLGADPHAWDPTPREIRAVSTADIFIYNGLGLEPWAPRLLAGAGHPDMVVVELAADLASELQDGARDEHPHGGYSSVESHSVEPVHGEDHPGHHHHDGINPHFWLDVTYAIRYVRRIQETLAAYDPDGAEYYKARADAYAGELAELDRWFLEQVHHIPPSRRVLVTYHNAYEHMANRYGLELAGFLVASPDHEASAQVMARLVHILRERHVPAVFVEPQIDPRLAETLSRETGARIGVLYTDSLTRDVPTYIDMMRANARALVELLQ